jgi:hypothetical protein
MQNNITAKKHLLFYVFAKRLVFRSLSEDGGY